MKSPTLLLVASVLLTAAVTSADETKLEAKLLEVEGSGVRGDVMLVELPATGTLAVVNVAGLSPDQRYLVVRAESGSCDIESYEEADVIADVTANSSGRATATLELEAELDEIQTVSVWTVEDALVACSVTRP
jgi:hypothetical protein